MIKNEILTCVLFAFGLLALSACASAAAPSPTLVPTDIMRTSTPGPTVAVTTTPLRIPPNIPFDHLDRTQCLACHGTGENGAPRVPTEFPDHRAFRDDRTVCETCHSQVR